MMKLSALAEELGLEYTGDDCEITGVNTLDKAGPDELSFLVNPKYQAQLETTKAGCVLTSGSYAEKAKCALISTNIYMDLAKVVNLFAEPQGCLSGISELAYIHPDATLGEDVTVYPFAFIGAGAVLKDGCAIFAGAYVGEKTTLGTNCIIYPNAVVMGGLTLGDNVIIQPGAVIGGDGYGYAQTPMGHMKIPQVGTVNIGSNVEVGANAAIDRAALDDTKIGQGTKIDNLVQIGHNVQVGDHCLIIGQTGIGGSTKIGNGVVLAGQVGVPDNVEIGDGAILGAKSGVAGNVPAGETWMGAPAIPAKKYMRAAGVCVPKLPELFKRVKSLKNNWPPWKRAWPVENLMSNETILDIRKIMELLPHRYPFLLVDRVIEFEAGVHLKAYKNVSMNEEFFQGHFPGLPVMPGVLQLEALAQAGGIFVMRSTGTELGDKVFLFTGINKVKFRKPVVPGDQLVLNVYFEKQKMNIWKMRGVAEVDGKVVCQGEFSAAVANKGDM